MGTMYHITSEEGIREIGAKSSPAKKGKAKAAKKGAKGRKAKSEEDDIDPTVEEAEPQAGASLDEEEEHMDGK